MSGVKYYTGSAWAEKPLKFYNGSTWSTPAVKIWTGGAWFTIGGAAPSVIDVTDEGAVGDGTTNNTSVLTTAANLAKSEGKSLYFPAGVYKVVDWAPPTDLTLIGDGITSHIKGFVRWRDGQTFRDLMIGDKTTKGIGPYYASGSITHEGVTFERCKFRGGGSQNSTLSHPAQGYGSQSIINHDITFFSCEWECNYTSTWVWPYAQAAQDVSWFCDRGTGDISTNIVFEDCQFGTLNEQGRTGGLFGGVVFWSSSSESYTTYPDMSSGYYDDIYFTRCIFEQADIWNLDMSGAQYNPTSFTENTCYIKDNVFKGLSGAYHSDYTTRVGSQEEPGHDSIWARNIFGIADSNALKFVKGSSRSQCYDNVFDYRTYANQIDVPSGEPMIDSIYQSNGIIRLGSEEANITIRDNTLLLPTGKYTSLSQQGWIYDPSSRAVKTGNAVQWAAGDGPLAAY